MVPACFQGLIKDEKTSVFQHVSMSSRPPIRGGGTGAGE
jgi:hypothetical protein